MEKQFNGLQSYPLRQLTQVQHKNGRRKNLVAAELTLDPAMLQEVLRKTDRVSPLRAPVTHCAGALPFSRNHRVITTG